MKQENLIKALKKQGWEVIRTVDKCFDVSQNDYWERVHYFCSNNKKKCDWYDQEVLSGVCVMGINQNTDAQYDHFPGSWCYTIKSIINLMVV